MATELVQWLSGQTIENSSGTPQAGAKIYFYQEDTTTDLTVWQDDAASTEHDQPIVCDAGGVCPLVYVDDTYDYKVVITTSADVTLYTYNNIPKAVDPTSGNTDFAKFLLEWTSTSSSTLSPTTSNLGTGYKCDTGSNDITVTLPSAISAGNGKGFVFKKTSASNTLTINAATSPGQQTIDARNLVTLTRENDMVFIVSDAANWQVIATNDYLQRLPMDYKAGCVLSTDTDSDHDINITAGEWRDADNTYDIILSSEITKQIDAAWAVGDDAGGIDTGSVSASTLYYIHLIANPTTGVVDALFSTSKASPTLPSGYTKNRVLGYLRTDSSANIEWVRSYVKKVNGGPDLVLKYTASAGNNGGSALGAAWTVITLNSIEYNRLELSGTVLSSNVFTLPAGTYKVDWTSVCYGTNDYATRLRNSSDSSVVGYAMNAYSTASSAHSESIGTEIVEITANKNFHIQYFVDVGTGGDGLGVARNIGGVEEIYNTVVVTRLDLED